MHICETVRDYYKNSDVARMCHIRDNPDQLKRTIHKLFICHTRTYKGVGARACYIYEHKMSILMSCSVKLLELRIMCYKSLKKS